MKVKLFALRDALAFSSLSELKVFRSTAYLVSSVIGSVEFMIFKREESGQEETIRWPISKQDVEQDVDSLIECISSEHPLYVRLLSLYVLDFYWYQGRDERIVKYLNANDHPAIISDIISLLENWRYMTTYGYDYNNVVTASMQIDIFFRLLECIHVHADVIKQALHIIDRLDKVPGHIFRNEDNARALISAMEINDTTTSRLTKRAMRMVGRGYIDDWYLSQELRCRIVRCLYTSTMLSNDWNSNSRICRLGKISFCPASIQTMIHMIMASQKSNKCILNTLPVELFRCLQRFLF